MFRRRVSKPETPSKPNPVRKDDEDPIPSLAEFTVKVKLGRFKGRLKNGYMSFKFDDGHNNKTKYSLPARSNPEVRIYGIQDLTYWVTVLHEQGHYWEENHRRPLTPLDADIFLLLSIHENIDQAYRQANRQLQAQRQAMN